MQMKQNRLKVIMISIGVLVILGSILLLCNSQKEILKIGKERVYRNEIAVYLWEQKKQYEQQFGKDIWKYEVEEGKTFAQLVKQQLLEQLIQEKVMLQEAKKESVKLSKQEEQQQQKKAQSAYQKLSKQEKKECGFSKRTLVNVYKNRKWLKKYQEILAKAEKISVSDQEAKQITILQLIIRTTKENKDGEEIPFTKEQKKTALKKAEQLLKKAKETSDFEALARKYSQESQIEFTFGKGEMDEPIETEAFQLKTGEISDIIQDEYGYHILYCVTDFDQAATKKRKAALLQQKKQEMFQKRYQQVLKQYAVQKKNWKEISF